MGYEYSKKFMDSRAMDLFETSDNYASNKYGKKVRAMELSNREYGHRYSKLRSSRTMKSPPSSGRIFAGYLVVRNLDTEKEYETWMPEYVFDEIYKKCVPDT